MKSRSLWIVAAIIAATIPLSLIRKPAAAMPPFAQAYSVDCNTCHTMVPGLNSYGRYVQRTMYSSLDFQTVHHEVSLWIGEQGNYSFNKAADQAANVSPRTELGNFAIHGAGYLTPDLTYHAQVWVWNNGGGGLIDTMWVTYNNLLHRDGHLSIGKMPAVGPSFLSQWFDISGFAPTGIVVGEHAYPLASNRWGAKLSYDKLNYLVEGGFFGPGSDLGGPDGATNFSATTEKTFQWRAAYSPAYKPIEAGVYGAVGRYPLTTEPGVDNYTAVSPYVEVDPAHNLPGALFMYQVAHDANPGLDANGNQLAAANSHAYSVELYRPIFKHWETIIAVREDMTDDGLGNLGHSGNVDLGLRLARFLRVYGEASMASGSTPTWNAYFWWTMPLERRF